MGRPAPQGHRAGLVAFFSSSCPGCSAAAPELARLADREPGGPDAVLVVVSGDDDAAARRLAGTVGHAATVLLEPEDGPVTTAFGVVVFPTFLRIDSGGTIVAAVSSVSELPDAARLVTR